MILLGLDFETTGLDFEKDRITEIGAVLWDTERQAPVAFQSELVFAVHGPLTTPEITAEITELTGIDQMMLNRYGVRPEDAFHRLGDLFLKAEYVVAHNGLNFDKIMLEKATEKLGFTFAQVKGWIDTKCDIPFPSTIKPPYSLTHLTAQHGIVNQFSHRALFDVLAMLKLLSLYNLNEVIKHTEAPTIMVKAEIPKPWEDAGVGRDKAKARRYGWDNDKKIWFKVLKQFQLEQEIKDAPFRVQLVDEPAK